MLLLLELGVSEDILKECVGLDAKGEVLYQMAKSQRQRGTLQMVGKGNATARLELRRWDDCLI